MEYGREKRRVTLQYDPIVLPCLRILRFMIASDRFCISLSTYILAQL